MPLMFSSSWLFHRSNRLAVQMKTPENQFVHFASTVKASLPTFPRPQAFEKKMHHSNRVDKLMLIWPRVPSLESDASIALRIHLVANRVHLKNIPAARYRALKHLRVNSVELKNQMLAQLMINLLIALIPSLEYSEYFL